MKTPALHAIVLMVLISVIAFSCKQQSTTEESSHGVPGIPSVFPRGQQITNDNFHGKAYLKTLVDADSINPTSIGNVTFEPGARTRWHQHPGGQILLVIEGVGYYQEKGQPKRTIKQGDVIKCPPDAPHWHGASADAPFVQVAVTNRHLGETVWLQEVTETEYNN